MIRIAIPPIGGDHWRGGWNYMLTLLRTMAADAPNDVKAVLFLGDEVDPAALESVNELAGIEIVRDNAFAAANWTRRIVDGLGSGVDHAALRAFRAARIDIALEADCYFGWRFPLPLLSWIPDFQHCHLPRLFSRWGRVRRTLRFRAQAWRPGVLVSSEDARSDCLRFFPAASGHVHVARFAAQPSVMGEKEVRRRIAALDLPARYFFVPNQLWVHKNHQLVIEAAKLLWDQGSPETVVMTGLGKSAFAQRHPQFLIELISRYGLERNVRMLGSVGTADVQALMIGATALINPSRFEGWSTTVEEAKATGTPMLLSDIAVHREQAGAAARYFPTDDAKSLAELITSQTSRSWQSIAADRRTAGVATEDRRHDFASAFVDAVRKAYARGTT